MSITYQKVSGIVAGVILTTLCFTLSGSHPGKPEQPNVLFIAIDDMNDWTTLFDETNPIQTPNLVRLAERGTFFTRGYCAVPACTPSRTAILTGYKPTTSGSYTNRDFLSRTCPFMPPGNLHPVSH